MMFSDAHRDDRWKARERCFHPTTRKPPTGYGTKISGKGPGKGRPFSSGYRRPLGTYVAGEDVDDHDDEVDEDHELPLVADLLDDEEGADGAKDDVHEECDDDSDDDDFEVCGVFMQRAFERFTKKDLGKGAGKGRARASLAGVSGSPPPGADPLAGRRWGPPPLWKTGSLQGLPAAGALA